jgi:MFS family permease
MSIPKHILPIIVISQFFCTSLWFAGNGIMDELTANFGLGQSALGSLTASVQFGFIIGTLIFAILSIADRFSPSKVFFVCAMLGALFNISIIWKGNTYESILVFRFFTGFFLAGIYPIGMKIAADYYDKTLGKSLGFLVGALVLGTALPHLLKDVKGQLPWELVLYVTSSIAALGGVLMITLVPDGPHKKTSPKLNFLAIPKIFSEQHFRAAAFGYFGHMWELYAFWAFVPVLLHRYSEMHFDTSFNIPLLSFFVIGIGSFACVLGGYLVQKIELKKVAFSFLLLSCVCCIIAPLLFFVESQEVFVAFILFWGMVVIADSPLFSTLVAQHAPSELKGTALTIVNSIGFALTIISIQLINELTELTNSPFILIILALGPIFGLIALRKKRRNITKPELH